MKPDTTNFVSKARPITTGRERSVVVFEDCVIQHGSGRTCPGTRFDSHSREGRPKALDAVRRKTGWSAKESSHGPITRAYPRSPRSLHHGRDGRERFSRKDAGPGRAGRQQSAPPGRDLLLADRAGHPLVSSFLSAWGQRDVPG